MTNLEYYKRFPVILRKALTEGKVIFPNTIKKDYSDICVYRGVKYNISKIEIDRTDFLSYMELKENNPMIMADETKINSYSCSCFLNLSELHMQTKFPSKNKAIAKGIIKQEYGPIDINEDTSHVDLFLFEDVDPSCEFEVIEKWEKNG